MWNTSPCSSCDRSRSLGERGPDACPVLVVSIGLKTWKKGEAAKVREEVEKGKGEWEEDGAQGEPKNTSLSRSAANPPGAVSENFSGSRAETLSA